MLGWRRIYRLISKWRIQARYNPLLFFTFFAFVGLFGQLYGTLPLI